jgi:(1->4)-alpha-D-glucan 1-alpha-D-glucosylmutase
VAVATRVPVELAARGGWCDTVLPLPGAATDRHDIVTGTPVDGSAPAPGTALLVRPA